MSCAGDTGISGESTCEQGCRLAWLNAVNDAWDKRAKGEITRAQLSALLNAASAAFATCIATCP